MMYFVLGVGVIFNTINIFVAIQIGDSPLGWISAVLFSISALGYYHCLKLKDKYFI